MEHKGSQNPTGGLAQNTATQNMLNICDALVYKIRLQELQVSCLNWREYTRVVLLIAGGSYNCKMLFGYTFGK